MATDIKQSARKFREYWTLAKDSEVGGCQKFWISLLGDVLGMDDVMTRISFQSPVQLKDTTKFLDAWIPETRVLIEHKALNRLCVRLVFCFYAEDADIFPKDALWTLLKNTESRNLRRALLTLFRTLDTPEAERDPYLTFRWDNESFEKAHVHCVIVGFHCTGRTGVSPVQPAVANGQDARCPSTTCAKTIFDNGKAIPAAHINGYLMDTSDAWIESRTKPLCDVPSLVFGSMPNDGGYLSDWSEEDRNKIVANYPAAEALFRRFMGATEFINNRVRWCLWLKDASPSAIRAVPPVMEAVSKVREMRIESCRAGTRKLADSPTLFGEIRQPDSNYLLLPCHSSESRMYIPLGYMDALVICGNANLMMPSATLYHFGVLTSSVHMAWMRVVAGRLKSDYRYSAAIVYNNFPWPEGGNDGTSETTMTDATETNETSVVSRSSRVSQVSQEVVSAISATAQAILDVRSRYPDSSLADLYDPLTMPPDLRAAHEANDRAVLAAYGLAPDTPEPEIVAHLFKLYAEMTGKTRLVRSLHLGGRRSLACREWKDWTGKLRSSQNH